MRALGLFNLILQCKMLVVGGRGREDTERVAMAGKSKGFSVVWKCHLVFMLPFEGNRFRDVE